MTAHLHRVRPDADETRPLGRPLPGAANAQPLLGGVVRFLGDCGEGVTELDLEGLVDHRRRFGHRPHTTGAAGEALIHDLEVIGLSGRGGGHFPVARKWRAVQAASAQAAGPGGVVVVGNGAEGEPLSNKDAALLQLRPHLVLDGLACAAEALRAGEAILWLHEGAEASYAAVMRALMERQAAGLVEPVMRVEVGPDHYLSGESSSLIRALSGGPALPLFRREPAARSGVHGKPTLVQNVETLARVATTARWSSGATHSTLLTIASPGHRVVVETEPTQRLGDVVTAVLGRTPLQAVLLGGYGGSWVPWDEVAGALLTEADLRRRGLSLGAGIVLPLRAGECGVTLTADIADYLAQSSARQCGPCLFGLRAVADVLAELADGSGRRRDLGRLHRFLAEITGRGGCNHPDGAVRMVATAMTTFADDVHAHLKGHCMHERRKRSGGRHG